MKKVIPVRTIVTRIETIVLPPTTTPVETPRRRPATVRLLGVLGVAALMLTIGLMTGRTGHTTTGGPVPVTAADNPAFQPFAQSAAITISDTGSTGTAFLTVPAGQRLVIQTVSAYTNGGAANTEPVNVFVQTTFNGKNVLNSIPTIPGLSSNYSSSTLAMTAYADPNTSVGLGAYRNGTSGSETVTVTVTGYLVNVPG